eukprot:scaffold60996_cov84-Phaeocystis_antarctica.AAC.6
MESAVSSISSMRTWYAARSFSGVHGSCCPSSRSRADTVGVATYPSPPKLIILTGDSVPLDGVPRPAVRRLPGVCRLGLVEHVHRLSRQPPFFEVDVVEDSDERFGRTRPLHDGVPPSIVPFLGACRAFVAERHGRRRCLGCGGSFLDHVPQSLAVEF